MTRNQDPTADQPPEGDLSEDLAQLNDWQDALAAMGQPAALCEDEVDEATEGPTDDARSTP